MKFKIGDMVRIIKPCDCNYKVGCVLLEGLNQVGKIVGKDKDWRIRISEFHTCHFTEEQLELVKKEVKKYGITLFLESIGK